MRTIFIHLNFCIMAWLKVHTVLHQPETEINEYLWCTYSTKCLDMKGGGNNWCYPGAAFSAVLQALNALRQPPTPFLPSLNSFMAFIVLSIFLMHLFDLNKVTSSPDDLENREFKGEGKAHWYWCSPNRHNGLMRPHCPGWHILSETTFIIVDSTFIEVTLNKCLDFGSAVQQVWRVCQVLVAVL